MQKIKVNQPLVVLHGDEMAQVAFDQILDTFVRAPLDIELIELDLSAENRLKTNGRIVRDAIETLITHGVGVKNAGMTVNQAQLAELLAAHPEIEGTSLDPLATKSPNGAIRKGIGGNIIREDIPFENIVVTVPDWIGRDIEVETMDHGGIVDSHNELCAGTGFLKLLFVGADGNPVELHRRRLNVGDPWLVGSNDIQSVREWAHQFFQRALEEQRDVYLGLKDTVIPGYDGVMRAAIEEVYKEHYAAQFIEAGLSYRYELIDAQAARMIASPPLRALWGIPDNTTGRKLYKLVEELKTFGISERHTHVSISRMSAGGGDQYGSYNAPAAEDGILKVVVDGEEKHARDVRKGDPIILMSNDKDAIEEWVTQVFRDASVNNKEVYFGLKREYMTYDEVFSQVISLTRRELADSGTPPPSYMIMRPSSQLKKMIADPPRNALYPAQNLDGDIFSDISAALGGSLATASSTIVSPSGTMLFEAPHGTAHDLYQRFLDSAGKEVIFNPSALLYAVANALRVLGERSANTPLTEYAAQLQRALIETVEGGVVTADLKGKTRNSETERVVDLPAFLQAVSHTMLHQS